MYNASDRGQAFYLKLFGRKRSVNAIVAGVVAGAISIVIWGLVVAFPHDIMHGATVKLPRRTHHPVQVAPNLPPMPSSAAPAKLPGQKGAIAGAASPLPYPSDLLELSYFELTLPIPNPATGNAMIVKQPELAKYSNNDYFFTLPTSNGVVFRAPVGGATTSGSQYPRTELREMANAGSQEASWSTTTGTHVMTLRESVDHLPVAKPQLVFAQIHGSKDDLIELEISNEGGKNRLYVNHNGKQYGSDLDSNYVLGVQFEVEISAEDGYVDVAYNGVQHVHQGLSDDGDYFKAGCYTQSNPSKGDLPSAYGQVTIYRVRVTHT